MSEVTVSNTDLTEKLFQSIAKELAMDIVPIETICDNHKITTDTLKTITKLPLFQQLYMEQKRIWDSALNTKERTQLRAASMIEQALPEMWLRLHEKGDFTTAKVELFKTIARIGGLGEKTDMAVGEKVQIVINMGDTQSNSDPVTINATAIPVEES